MDTTVIVDMLHENPRLSIGEIWKKMGEPMPYDDFHKIVVQLALMGPLEKKEKTAENNKGGLKTGQA